MMRVEARWIIRRDMDEVIAIERDSFPVPWTEDDFRYCLQKRNVVGTVMVSQVDKIVGYAIYEMHKNSYRILNFAVHSDARRQAVGRRMVQLLVKKLRERERNEIVLDVTDANTIAQMFFASCGFRAAVVSSSLYEMRYTVEDSPQKSTGTVMWSAARSDNGAYDVAVRLKDGREEVIESPVIRRMGETVAVWL